MFGTTHTPKVATSDQVKELVHRAQTSGSLDGIDGKRKFPRFLATVPLQVTPDPSKPRLFQAVKMHNVSEGGIAFWSKKRLPLHKRLFVREVSDDGASDWLPAIVCHCTRGLLGFLIGIEFVLEPAA